MKELGLEGLFDFSELNQNTQNHLKKVYAILSSGVVVSLVVFCLCQQINLPSNLFYFLGIIALLMDVVLIFVNRNSAIRRDFSHISFFSEATLIGGYLGNEVAKLDDESRIISYKLFLSAFVYALAIFASFSIFSILTSNRLGVYTLASLSSLIIIFISFFIFGFMGQIIIGVILCILYIIIDTQNIIFRSKEGVNEPFIDAKMLFVDLVKLICKIHDLFDNKEKEKDKDKDKNKKK